MTRARTSERKSAPPVAADASDPFWNRTRTTGFHPGSRTMKHGQLAVRGTKWSLASTAQQMNDGGYEGTKCGARRVRARAATCASINARGGDAAEPPRPTLEGKRQKELQKLKMTHLLWTDVSIERPRLLVALSIFLKTRVHDDEFNT